MMSNYPNHFYPINLQLQQIPPENRMQKRQFSRSFNGNYKKSS